MTEFEPEKIDDGLPLFDGGDTGCGELLLDLLLFMKRQPAGAIVQVRALDPGAPREIPAWCRLTHNELLASDHPLYRIQKNDSKEKQKHE